MLAYITAAQNTEHSPVEKMLGIAVISIFMSHLH